MKEKFRKILKRLYLYNLARLFRFIFLRLCCFFLMVWKKFYYLFVPTALALVYHRIADVENDPHLLSVSPDNFYQQLNYLKNNFNIIKLSELVENLRANKLKNKSVVITFDDGYADNLRNGLPILEKLGIPATIFMVAGKINSQSPFSWDENTLKQDQGKALNHEELAKLASSPLIEIGSHTITHPCLSQLPYEQKKGEIAESKIIIEKLIKKPINSFSYPFGSKKDIDRQSVDLAMTSGYQYACSNIQSRITKKSHLFLLPRRLIRNWDLKKFKLRLKMF